MKCPRCVQDTGFVISTSPVAGVWEMYMCGTCRYTWRSTDVPENRDPDKYPANFRWDAANMDKLRDFPPIPKQK